MPPRKLKKGRPSTIVSPVGISTRPGGRSGGCRLPLVNIDAAMGSEMLQPGHLPVSFVGQGPELLELGQPDVLQLAVQENIVRAIDDRELDAAGDLFQEVGKLGPVVLGRNPKNAGFSLGLEPGAGQVGSGLVE